MKPRCFSLSGAAVMAALIFASPAAAQGLDETPLFEDLGLETGLGDAALLSGLPASGDPNYRTTASIRQQGSGNRAEISQTSSGYSAFAVIAQYGEDNLANVDQCSCGNIADILQDGSANQSDIIQTGQGNVFVHRQYGDALSLSVTQSGGAQIAITQTGP